MRVHAIGALRTAVEPGQSKAAVPFKSASLHEGKGIFLLKLASDCQLMFLDRYSILPGMSLSGILHVNIVVGSFDAEKFGEFINILLTQMNPFPGLNSVIVMDNCRIHKLPFILEMIEERYVSIYLANLTTKRSFSEE